MLEHTNSSSKPTSRTVILGAKGFVGTALTRRLENSDLRVLPLGRQEIDLLSTTAADQLEALLDPTDSLVIISAKAPVKDHTMLSDNINMISPICNVLQKVTPAQVIYISSDAVYSDSMEPLKETSPAEPGALHGVMHLMRELMLKSVCQSPLAILRPSLLYGLDDPHNGYGPNQFRRRVAEGKAIKLFGQGEEQRDHVFIDDVGELIYRILMHRSRGVLNIATGDVASFKDVANLVRSQFDESLEIEFSPRIGPMPHNGYRPFAIDACKQIFPDFSYTSLADGIAITHRNMMETL
jgi:UDP-glucose 4-epimerase